MIIGDFNRGKSTILNAFFGKSVLPMGVTATTAIPTFVKYGKQEKVVVHKKDGKQESLNFEQYKKKYTLNSKEVKNKIKNVFKSVGGWLNPLDYAEFYCPIEVLSRGVEFIDTAGLNHTEEENKKTFSYIQECHAILFVLAADQQFTQQEQDYLKRLLGIKKEIENSENQSQFEQGESAVPQSKNTKQVRPIFYLINKWENVGEDETEEIHEIFIDKFCECLDISENEAAKMWGNTVFDVYAKTALENLEQGKSIDGTGLKEFQKRLNDFLIHERLMTELLQTVDIAKIAEIEVTSKINERLFVLEDKVKTLEAEIEETKPYVALMKKSVQTLEKSIISDRKACIAEVAKKYRTYFSQLAENFEEEFKMPEVFSLEDDERKQYTQDLENKLTKHLQDKLEIWYNRRNQIVSETIETLRNSFDTEKKDYSQKRDVVRKILNGGSFNIESPPRFSITQSSSSEKSSLTTADAAGSRFGVALGSAAGAYIVSGTIAGLALTPVVGWALLGGSAVVGGVVGLWRAKDFQKKMQERAKEEFKKLLKEEEVSALKKQVGELFNPYEKSAKLMREDVESLEKSLGNLLEMKRKTSVNTEAEKKRLQTFVHNISDQFQTIEAKYNEIALAQSKSS
ncbi:dynamin family protein [Okeania sp. KiyG1]|uniref:dynamin family protein n=1 Tax=Okeania sp. KiyG1 TaxID=2720165 RepID=UPI001920E7DC|nr:dynamin family protein [Okeania sp. KiyG1]GGA54455.1 hypothetical protein CYANOKiyG1_74780 [Okeania sp. KiyG1]